MTVRMFEHCGGCQKWLKSSDERCCSSNGNNIIRAREQISFPRNFHISFKTFSFRAAISGTWLIWIWRSSKFVGRTFFWLANHHSSNAAINFGIFGSLTETAENLFCNSPSAGEFIHKANVYPLLHGHIKGNMRHPWRRLRCETWSPPPR